MTRDFHLARTSVGGGGRQIRDLQSRGEWLASRVFYLCPGRLAAGKERPAMAVARVALHVAIRRKNDSRLDGPVGWTRSFDLKSIVSARSEREFSEFGTVRPRVQIPGAPDQFELRFVKWHYTARAGRTPEATGRSRISRKARRQEPVSGGSWPASELGHRHQAADISVDARPPDPASADAGKTAGPALHHACRRTWSAWSRAPSHRSRFTPTIASASANESSPASEGSWIHGTR
jgi:hypothetical protein